jgi:hypothetical protein
MLRSKERLSSISYPALVPPPWPKLLLRKQLPNAFTESVVTMYRFGFFIALAGLPVVFLIFYYVALGIWLRLLGSQLRQRSAPKRELILRRLGAGEKGKIVGFFHPYW